MRTRHTRAHYRHTHHMRAHYRCVHVPQTCTHTHLHTRAHTRIHLTYARSYTHTPPCAPWGLLVSLSLALARVMVPCRVSLCPAGARSLGAGVTAQQGTGASQRPPQLCIYLEGPLCWPGFLSQTRTPFHLGLGLPASLSLPGARPSSRLPSRLHPRRLPLPRVTSPVFGNSWLSVIKPHSAGFHLVRNEQQ